MIRDQFIGVIATDILVSALEKILMPKLKNIKQKAIVINDSSRVITSNDITIRTGTLFKRPKPRAVSVTTVSIFSTGRDLELYQRYKYLILL